MNMFLKKRVFAFVIHILIVALGIISFGMLSIREYPKISEPIISVEIEYPGASPRSVKRDIAAPLVDAISSIQGLRRTEIHINGGMLRGSLKFESTVSPDNALINVISKVDGIINLLPQGLRRPLIRKSDDSSAGGIYLAIVPKKDDSKYNSNSLAEVMSRYVKNPVESIYGVASMYIPGAVGSELKTLGIDVFLKPEALSMYKITAYDVYRAIHDESNVDPAGDFKIGPMFYSVQIAGSLNSVEEFRNIVIKDNIRVKDIARVEITKENNKSYRLRYNQKVCAFGFIRLQPNANIIDVSKALEQKLQSIREIIPDANLELMVTKDDSIPIKESINRVYSTIIEAIISVAIVILFFLKTWRFAIISLVTIPICCIAGFFILYMCGATINMLTLFALVLAIGLVVDDAIIVCERIHVKIKQGLGIFDACNQGIQEIQFSLLAMTFTLVSVYLPLIFAKGILGKMFIEFAILLSGTVVISGVVAYILTPVMCFLMLSHDDEEVSVFPIKSWNNVLKRPVELFNIAIDKIEEVYVSSLRICLHNRVVCIWASIVIFLLSLMCAKSLRSITSPAQDKNSANIRIQLPPKTAIFEIELLMQKIEEIISSNKDVEGFTTQVSQGEGIEVWMQLKNLRYRHKSDREVAKAIRDEIDKKLTAGRISYSTGSYDPFSSDSSGRFAFEIRTDTNTETLLRFVKKMVNEMGKLQYKNTGISYSRLDPQRNYVVTIDREKAYMLGIKFDELRYSIINTLQGNPPAKRYDSDGKRYPVSVWTSEKMRENLRLLDRFFIRSSKSNAERDDREMVPLSAFIKVVASYEVQNIAINDGLETCSIWWDLDESVDQIKAFEDIKKLGKQILPKKGFSIQPSEALKKAIEESGTFYFIFSIAVLFVYLFMAALFESFVLPLIVICTIPLALSGALFSLWSVVWGSLNIWSYVGILTLVGLITKNGILLVEFFNTELQKGENNPFECAIKSGQIRLRPILMTTVAMIVSAVNLSLGHGVGYELMRQIGIVITGGLLFGTALTLYLVPCLCVTFAPKPDPENDTPELV